MQWADAGMLEWCTCWHWGPYIIHLHGVGSAKTSLWGVSAALEIYNSVRAEVGRLAVTATRAALEPARAPPPSAHRGTCTTWQDIPHWGVTLVLGTSSAWWFIFLPDKLTRYHGLGWLWLVPETLAKSPL